MDISSVLTNDFKVRYDEGRQVLQITTVHNGKPAAVPIEIRLKTLLDMEDAQEASRWFGETILLLVPELRTELFKLPEKT
jgi:hypothetical protein